MRLIVKSARFFSVETRLIVKIRGTYRTCCPSKAYNYERKFLVLYSRLIMLQMLF